MLCIEYIHKHPDEITNLSDFAISELQYIHKVRMDIYKEMEKEVRNLG